MTTTGDGGGWNRRRAGCSRKDTVAMGWEQTPLNKFLITLCGRAEHEMEPDCTNARDET